jgi:adenylylsulfate kinase
MVPRPSHGAEARENFYRTLAGLAALLAWQGLVVIVAATAHRRAFRSEARVISPRFFEVYVMVDLATCQARDAKGLYAAAAQGFVQGVPGFDLDYEPPERPDFILSSLADSAVLDSIVAAAATP